MKKGFTLVELLAVIVILAVILVIAVPQINNVIKETRKNSLGSTAKLIAAKAEEKEVENDALEISDSITCADLVKLDNNYGNCTISKNSTTGKWEVTIVGTNKFSGYTCTGTKDNMSCTERDTNTPEYLYSFETPYYEDGNLINVPVEDYTQLNKNVFIRWNGNETSFSDTSEKWLCTMYKAEENGGPTCIKTHHFGNSEEQDAFNAAITDLFSDGTCSSPYDCADGAWKCRYSFTVAADICSYQGNNYSQTCQIDEGTYNAMCY